MGYHRAGFDVVGVDIKLQSNYPFKFHQADAMTYSTEGFDAIHASPPCQAYSRATKHLATSIYPELIDPIRLRLQDANTPYVIENVVGAPLIDPILLCGAMFNRPTYRHRLFETNFPVTGLSHPKHTIRASKAGHWEPGTYISVAGNCAPIQMAREAMDIDWMRRDELAEAIPPYFTQFIGLRILRALQVAA
jgi:DNA (cytosine-5)-methyltransferase 1